ncbi:MAG TPA: carbohydrate binding domain-containing protein, partial [Patescibacteria group bacterium]|nr:carbohydrate binding domain-containing protein [Patescibacteria group bacterium]
MRQTAQKFKLFVSRPTLALAVFTVLLLVSMTGTYVLNVRRAAAATNSTINFQARLMDASGAIAPDGNYNVEFKLYNAITSSGSSQGSCTGDASCLWAETRTSANTVHVANGYVTVSLGSVTSFPTTINWDQKLWLTMNIGGTGTPTWDGEMTPRLQLTAVPYAFRAGQLATLSGVNTASLQFAGSFGQNTTITLPDPGASTASVCYQTATACGFAPTSGSANYIQNTTTAQSANIAVQSSADASVTLLLKQRSTQTADILRIADSSNTTIFNVDAFGDMHQSGAASFNSYVGVGMASSSGEQLRVAVLNASTSGLTIYANSAQTADLIGVDGAGTRALNYTGAGTLVVTAGSGQATSLLDLRNTTGDTLSKFDASGQLTLGRIAASGTTQAGTLIFSDGTNDNFGVTLNTNTLTANRTIRLPDAGGTICLQSSASCGFATGTTASYIQNQNAGQQATSNYWISGTGRSDTSLLTPALDTAIAGTLSLGTTTATAIALNKDTTITGALTQSGGAFSLTGNNNSSISTSANALTITSTSTATWSVTAGTLNLQANSTNNRLELNGAGNIVTLHSGGTLNLGDANSSLVYLGGTTNNVRTINVGVGGGLLTQAQTVNVGSLAGTSVTTVNGGSGSGAIALTPAANGGIIATTTGTGSISLNSGASIIAKSTTNNNAAFQIQNTAAETVLGVDTTANAANLVTNPSFETNTTNWSQRTGCALSRVGTTVAFGAWSGDCLTSATANAGVNYALTLSSSTQYTMSFYAKASGSFSTLDFGYAQNGATENTAGLVKTGNTVNSTGWQRYTLTFTTGTVSGSPYFFFKQSDAVLRDIYIDGLQVEASGGASAYESSKLSFNGGVSSSLIVQPAENSNTALAVYTNGGTQAFNVNTLTNRVGIGSLNAGARLHVAGSTSSIPVQIVQGASGQSTDILQIEDSNDNVNAAFNSTGAQLTLGRVSNVAGKLVLNDSASAFGTTLQNATLTVGSQTITIPNTAGAGGTICLQSSASCGFATGTTASYIQNQNAGQQATSN